VLQLNLFFHASGLRKQLQFTAMPFEDTRDALSWDQGRQWSHGELVETNLTIFLTDWWLPIQLEVVRTRLSEPLIAAYPNGGAL